MGYRAKYVTALSTEEEEKTMTLFHDQTDVENAVYKAMSRVEWRRGSAIERDINEGRELDNSVTLAQIYVTLDRAELAGWAEHRTRVVTQASLGRKPVKHKIGEWKLTGGPRGLKRDDRGLLNLWNAILKPA
jgi:hypothetical protein